MPVITDPHFTFNGVDLSDMVKQGSFPEDTESNDDTTSGDGLDTTHLPGKRRRTMELTFRQNYGASGADSVDATLQAAYDAGTIAAYEWRPSQSAVGVSNPKRTGSCFVTSYSGLDGGIGSPQDAKVSFQVTGAVTRATA